jgi:hypothetical protein
MLSLLSFAATLAIATFCSVLIVKTIRTSGEKIMLALTGTRPAADIIPMRRRPARTLKAVQQPRLQLRAAA